MIEVLHHLICRNMCIVLPESSKLQRCSLAGQGERTWFSGMRCALPVPDPCSFTQQTESSLTWSSLYMHACEYIYIYVYVYLLSLRVYVNFYSHKDVRMCMYMYMCMCIHTCIYIYIYRWREAGEGRNRLSVC